MTQVRLTTKQRKVLDLLEAGANVKEVARQMKISEAGVYGHVRNLRKAGVTLPAERMGPSGGNGHASSTTNGSPFIAELRRQLEGELKTLDAERGRLVAAIRVLA